MAHTPSFIATAWNTEYKSWESFFFIIYCKFGSVFNFFYFFTTCQKIININSDLFTRKYQNFLNQCLYYFQLKKIKELSLRSVIVCNRSGTLSKWTNSLGQTNKVFLGLLDYSMNDPCYWIGISKTLAEPWIKSNWCWQKEQCELWFQRVLYYTSKYASLIFHNTAIWRPNATSFTTQVLHALCKENVQSHLLFFPKESIFQWMRDIKEPIHNLQKNWSLCLTAVTERINLLESVQQFHIYNANDFKWLYRAK